MAEPGKPHDDDRIEELLSQLQGIFGKLSHSEEEESRQKVDPAVSPASPKETPPPVKSEPPEIKSPPPAAENVPAPVVPEPPSEIQPAEVPAAAAPVESPASAPEMEAMPEPPAAPPPPPALGADNTLVYAGLFYPPGRDAQAKILADKIQTMTPKFTKVTFQLNVSVFLTYDPKTEWKDTLLQKLGNPPVQTVFLVVDRPLEETKRKALVGELEARGIYFQEVPLTSIEKKAFYTDLLLGLVFFFDSQKSPPAEGSR